MDDSAEHQTRQVWLVDDLRVDAKRGNVTRNAVELALPELSFRLLLALVKAAPNRVAKDQLIAEVWAGGVVSDETLTQRVRLLRQALGDSLKQPRYIAAVRNFGYRLVAPVTAGQSEPNLEVPSVPTHRRHWLIAACLLSLLVAVAAMLYQPSIPDSGSVRGRSIAVLPLRNLNADVGQEYLVDGIHYELINRLSRLDGLSVVSRTSVLPYVESGLKSSEIAEQLRVDFLLEGDVQRSGDRLRVHVQLIDGANDRNVWSQVFERNFSMQSLFEIQSTVAENLASALQLEISGTDRSKLVRLPTTDLANYDRFLLGRHHVYKLSSQDLAIAVGLLEQVVSKDPAYAQAWAALGRAYAFQASGYADVMPVDIYPKALAASQQALQLNPNLADAHSLQADLLAWYEWDWLAAEKAYQTTMALDPGNVAGYALFQSVLTRHEAAVTLITSLTARYPNDSFYRINSAWRYLNARQYGEALREAERSVGRPDALSIRGWALLGLNDVEGAVAAFERDLAVRPNSPIAQSNLAIAQIRAGRVEQGRAWLAQLLEAVEVRYVQATSIAALYFALGEADHGFAWLQRAKNERDRGIIFLQVDHAYDGYRDDQRYRELLEDLGFPADM